MVIEEGLHAYLVGHAGLTALVGARVYPLKAPDDAMYPLVVYQRISGPRVYSHDGASGLSHPRFQLTSWGEIYPDAKAVAKQVRLAMSGYSGTMGDDVAVDACFLVNELDRYDQETKRWGIIQDYMIWHHE